ncbi:condensation domain-containing protein [Spongiactinospora sp. TRM90649]|uniref:condensation domain-containing protein n=1 Tax=Spongiactinospora sp. TRM90649 TaxID=3031114 RepID=UPI0023F7B19F|nr:condensation domain-containing protein [Spongiactinospora sp. TRM90649]MDF5754043.1 condensation domain-containing protein [Spongiactinospora sp. TRM90649]
MTTTTVDAVQHGMWINERLGAGSAYHMPVVIRLRGPLDRGALIKACAGVVERHPALSGAVEERDGLPFLRPGHAAVEVAEIEDGAAGREALSDVLRREVTKPFDLAAGPLVRFTLVRESPLRHLLLAVAHHVVFDGMSKDLLAGELAALYNGNVPPGAAAGHRDSATEPDAAFWADRWREPGPLALPSSEARSRGTADGRAIAFEVEADLSVPGLTRFELLTAALHALLYSYGNAEVVTAIDLSTRRPADAATIGSFVNELPLFSRPRADQPFADFAQGVRAELRALYPHRRTPLARAVPGLRPHAALAPVSVSYRKREEADPEFAGLDASVDWLVSNHAVRGALQFQFLDTPAGLSASLRHDPSETPDADRVAADLRALLDRIAADPAAPLSALLEIRAAVVQEAPSGETTAAASETASAAHPLADEVAAIWEEVLGISPIGHHDDIFDLGAHSLTITQIIARMRKRLKIEVPLDAFFETPTIAGVLQAAGRD